VATAVSDLVDPEGLDGAQDPVFQSPLNDPLDRAIDLIPRGVKRPGDLQPREFTGPSREKLHVGRRQMMLTLGPGQDLGDNAACGAIHPSAGIAEEYRKAPKRNKLKAPLRELVITRAALPTARAIGLRAPARNHLDLNGVRARLGPLDLAVHEALETITAIQ